MNSQLEQLINIDVFLLALEGLFSKWKGNYDVLLVDRGEYLAIPKGRSAYHLLYQEVLSSSVGYQISVEDDLQHAITSKKKNSPIVYYNPLGLFNVTIPVVILNEHVANIIFGHLAPLDVEQQRSFKRNVEKIEDMIGIGRGVLWRIARKIPNEPSQTTVDRFINEVLHFLEYLPYLQSQKSLRHKIEQEQTQLERKLADLEAEKYELMITRDKANLRSKKLLATSVVLQSAAIALSDVQLEWDTFWYNVSKILRELVDIIDAEWGLIFLPSERVQRYISKSNSIEELEEQLLTIAFKSKIGKSIKDIIGRKIDETLPYFPDFSFMKSLLKKYDPVFENNLDTVQIMPFNLNNSQIGILAIFRGKNHKTNTYLTTEEETSILEQFLVMLNTAAYHRDVYKQSQDDLHERQVWLEKVTHQLMGPMNALVGATGSIEYTLNSWRDNKPYLFENWINNEFDKLSNKIINLAASANFATRLADNLAWVIYSDTKKTDTIALSKCDRVATLFISYATMFQGLAREKNLKTVTVINDKGEFSALDNRLYLDENRFRQAIGNLIENAIKYSSPSTTVTITAKQENNWAIISINNVGIRIYPSEVEKIFEYEYRAEAARDEVVSGTGIGLYVAQELIKLHNGIITVEPSEKSHFGWYTSFKVRLPLDGKIPH